MTLHDRITNLLAAHHGAAPADTAAAVCALLRDDLGGLLQEREREQTGLYLARTGAGLADLAREHALRARTHHRDRHTIVEALAAPAAPEPRDGYDTGVRMAIDHLDFLAARVPPAGDAARTLRRWVRERAAGVAND